MKIVDAEGSELPWDGKAAKEYRAVMGNKPVGGIFSMGVEEANGTSPSNTSADFTVTSKGGVFLIGNHAVIWSQLFEQVGGAEPAPGAV